MSVSEHMHFKLLIYATLTLFIYQITTLVTNFDHYKEIYKCENFENDLNLQCGIEHFIPKCM